MVYVPRRGEHEREMHKRQTDIELLHEDCSLEKLIQCAWMVKCGEQGEKYHYHHYSPQPKKQTHCRILPWLCLERKVKSQ